MGSHPGRKDQPIGKVVGNKGKEEVEEVASIGLMKAPGAQAQQRSGAQEKMAGLLERVKAKQARRQAEAGEEKDLEASHSELLTDWGSCTKEVVFF